MKPTIRQLNDTELKGAVPVIRAAFDTVALDFHLTTENCPTNAAFIRPEHLEYDRQRGALQYGAFFGEELAGFFELFQTENAVNLKRLAVPPHYRHKGVGRAMLDFAEETARALKAQKLTLDYIEENTLLKSWYISAGFIFLGTKKFGHLPFTVGFMEKLL